MNASFTKKLATVALLFVLATCAFADPPRKTPGTERFGPATAPAQNSASDAPPKEPPKSGDLMTAKKMEEIIAKELAGRGSCGDDSQIFAKPRKKEDVKALAAFYAVSWRPDKLPVYDQSDPDQQRAKDAFKALWNYDSHEMHRSNLRRMIDAIIANKLTERVWQLNVSLVNYEKAEKELLPMLRRFDECYNAFMTDMKRLENGGKLRYGAGDGRLANGWEIFSHSGMDILMNLNGEPKPRFDRALRVIAQANAICAKSNLDTLKADLKKARFEALKAQESFRGAYAKIEKTPGYKEIMNVMSTDENIINAAIGLYDLGMKIIAKLEDDGTICGRLRHFKDIDRFGGLVQDGVSYSDGGDPDYRHKVRRGFEEMKKAYEKWAAQMSQKYDNVKQYLRWQ